MKEKDLKHMNRSELLQMLLAQAEEVKSLRAQLEQAQAQLQERKIAIDEAGSIAEAALKLNGVFDAAQAAAQEYLDNIQSLSGRQEEVARKIQEEAEEKARQTMAQADAYSQKVHREADEYLKQVLGSARSFLQDHGIQTISEN